MLIELNGELLLAERFCCKLFDVALNADGDAAGDELTSPFCCCCCGVRPVLFKALAWFIGIFCPPGPTKGLPCIWFGLCNWGDTVDAPDWLSKLGLFDSIGEACGKACDCWFLKKNKKIY